MAVTFSLICVDNANGTLTITPAVGGSATQTGGTALTTVTVGNAALTTDALKEGVVAQGIQKAMEYVRNSYAQSFDVDTEN